MLVENFLITEEAHYRLISNIAYTKSTARTSPAINKPLNSKAMNIKNNLKKTLNKLALILMILICMNGEVYSFASAMSLKVSSGSYSDETVVRIVEPATYDFDNDFDAYKLMNLGNTPNLFTSLNGMNYSINSFPGEFESFDMPLNLKVAFSGSYSITAKAAYITSYDSLYVITLEDKLLNSIHTLGEQSVYSFQASTEDMEDRFILHYVKRETTIDNNPAVANVADEIDIYSLVVTESGAQIEFLSIAHDYASVGVITQRGKVIYAKDNLSTHSQINIPLTEFAVGTVYVLKVITGETISYKKFSF